MEPKGAARRKTVVIDNFEGKAFGLPNDLVILRNGGMYFTDSANAQPRPAEPLPLPAAFYYLPMLRACRRAAPTV